MNEIADIKNMLADSPEKLAQFERLEQFVQLSGIIIESGSQRYLGELHIMLNDDGSVDFACFDGKRESSYEKVLFLDKSGDASEQKNYKASARIKARKEMGIVSNETIVEAVLPKKYSSRPLDKGELILGLGEKLKSMIEKKVGAKTDTFFAKKILRTRFQVALIEMIKEGAV